VIGRDVVTVVLADTLTKAERNLAAAGKGDMVLQMRQEFQRAMREDLVAAVEMLMERSVSAFMSADHIDPGMARRYSCSSRRRRTRTPSTTARKGRTSRSPKWGPACIP
jgi:hypothetical protein